jgi:chaperonin GroEL (HSP60 family)
LRELREEGADAARVQVLVTDPTELEKIRERESDITKERIRKILDAGANVVLTTKGIDDMALKYFVEAGVIACRRVSKEDMRYGLSCNTRGFHCSAACRCRWEI